MRREPAMQLDERRVAVSQMTDDEVQAALDEQGVGLTVGEARRVAELLGRDPTVVEMHIFNVEWSEHCSYKSSRATLKEFLPTDAPNVILGPQEDAGHRLLHRARGQALRASSWPTRATTIPRRCCPTRARRPASAGIVRDVDCMGARVIATADPLRFGDPTGPEAEPHQVDRRAASWTASGSTATPSACRTWPAMSTSTSPSTTTAWSTSSRWGWWPRRTSSTRRCRCEAADEPYDLILVGKPTDDSRLRRVAPSPPRSSARRSRRRTAARSRCPTRSSRTCWPCARPTRPCATRAKELGITIGIKDIGGGGLACGTSEITDAGGFGRGDRPRRGARGPRATCCPRSICCAETQERYVLAVPASFTPEVLRIYNEDWDLPNVYEGAQARVIGRDTSRSRSTG